MSNIIRQGDVILIPVNKLPEDAKPLPLDGDSVILAYGERTGHAHRLRLPANEVVNAAIRKAKLYALSNGQRFLEVREPVALTHEEHTAHIIPAGYYEVPIQVDMTTDKLPRRVAD